MTDPKKKGKYIGLLGAVLVHVAFIVFLFLMGFTLPEPQEESGVSVMLGDVPQASGWSDPSLVEVETMPAEEVVPQDAMEQELITQDVEETVALTPESEKETEKLGLSFFRCHRSYLINIAQVRAVEKEAAVFPGGIRVPVSRRLYQELNRRFIEYFLRTDRR